MFYLLLEEDKVQGRREYSLRRIITGLFLFSLIAAAFGAALLPSLFIARAKEYAARLDLATASSTIQTEEAVLRGEIKEVNGELIVLSSVSSNRISQTLETFFSKIPPGIAISSIFFDVVSDELKITAIAQGRQNVVDFQKMLVGSGLFKTVEVPLSSLTESHDINFTVVTTGTW